MEKIAVCNVGNHLSAAVIGSSRGIGHAVSHALLERGLTVALCSRGAPSDLQRDFDNAHFFPVDVRSEQAVSQCVRTVAENLGCPTLFVVNAGVGYGGKVLSIPVEATREMIETNLLGAILSIRACTLAMKKTGIGGQIVVMGSLGGHRVADLGTVYSATKYGLRAFVEGFRRELLDTSPPIRIGMVSPGYVDTDFTMNFRSTLTDQHPPTGFSYEVLQVQDIVEAVLFLASRPPHVQVHDLLLRPRLQPN